MIDYVLTVAVSIAAGVAAITSAFPQWHINRVEMTLAFVIVIMIGNLRGIRESERIFALPTYLFVVSLLLLIAVGAWRALTGVEAVSNGVPAFKPPESKNAAATSTGLNPRARPLRPAFLEYIEQVDSERPDDFLTVVLPEFVREMVAPSLPQPTSAPDQRSAAASPVGRPDHCLRGCIASRNSHGR